MKAAGSGDEKAHTQAPPTKRSRQEEQDTGKKNGDDSSSALLGVIAPSVMSSGDELSAYYRSAQPYRHGLISDLCVPGFLNKVLDEVKNNSKVTFKESDLFRVYQSIDLANLSPGTDLAKSMPSLMSLRTALIPDESSRFWRRESTHTSSSDEKISPGRARYWQEEWRRFFVRSFGCDCPIGYVQR